MKISLPTPNVANAIAGRITDRFPELACDPIPGVWTYPAGSHAHCRAAFSFADGLVGLSNEHAAPASENAVCREVCLGCKREIDRDTCHCWSASDDHNQGSGHSPVPMGCACHLDRNDEEILF